MRSSTARLFTWTHMGRIGEYPPARLLLPGESATSEPRQVPISEVYGKLSSVSSLSVTRNSLGVRRYPATDVDATLSIHPIGVVGRAVLKTGRYGTDVLFANVQSLPSDPIYPIPSRV